MAGPLKNARHERFAQELATGKTADEAYSAAGYEANRGNATRLKANDNVLRRVAEIQERGAKRAEVTVETILDELEEARTLAIRQGLPAPAVSASMGKAKVAGILVDKQEVTGKDGGPVLVASDADRAKALAAFMARTKVTGK